MKKKNLLIAILIILVLILLLLVIRRCAKQNPALPQKPLNETVDLNAVFSQIENAMEEENQEEAPLEEAMDNEIDSEIEAEDTAKQATTKTWPDEEEIDFGDFNFLTKKAIVHTTDDKVNEVWMVKLTSLDQQEALARIFRGRTERLKEAFHDNEEQLAVISNAVIKQEDGIMIAIISPSVNKIEKTIADSMK